MSDATNTASPGGSQNPQNPWKWMTIGLGGLMAVALVVTIVRASFDKSEAVDPTSADEVAAAETTEPAAGKPAASKPAAPKSAPVRVAAAPPAAPAVASPPRPTAADMAACNDYATSVRTQPNDVVKSGVIGGALGAGVGAATGAIADGGKGAGKGAGIGAIVGATAGTLYGLNQRNQDDVRAEHAYRQCMADRGF